MSSADVSAQTTHPAAIGDAQEPSSQSVAITDPTVRVRALNDAVRRSFTGGWVIETPACSIPRGGPVDHHAARDALWAKFSTAAPARRRQSVAQYSYVKRV